MIAGVHAFLKRRGVVAIFILVGLAFSLSSFASAATALICGIAIAFLFGNPFKQLTQTYTPTILACSVAGLGAGLNLITIYQAGLQGLGLTALTISSTLLLGFFIGWLFKSDRDTTFLISVGTAICGGSAIAAVAPVLRARPQAISVAISTVFLLNALALLVFPVIGHFFGLSQHQFGLWSALAIHDTSSVVGAGLQYGTEALQTGVTVKLARTLWIIPLTIGFGLYFRHPGQGHVLRLPWFIAGFAVMAALVTWVPALHDAGHLIGQVAQRGLVLALFLIGLNLSPESLKNVGARPFLQGLLLWLIVSVTAFLLVRWVA
jgi:uncharacterized integral membrane protein (TIGR00698 family)